MRAQKTATFTYTAERQSYVAIASAFVGLLLIESGMTALLVAALVHVALVRVLVHAALAVLTVAAAAMLLAPLVTRHRLTPTHLHLQYGLDVRAAVPRDAIAAAEAWHEPVAMMQPFRAQFDEAQGGLLAAFSERGQILLRLRAPVTVRVARRQVAVDTVLINADRRDELLDAVRPMRIGGATSQPAIESLGHTPKGLGCGRRHVHEVDGRMDSRAM